MNLEKTIQRVLRLQAKIIKACGRNFGSLKSFNSKYPLKSIDWVNQTAEFQNGRLSDTIWKYSFKLIRTEGKRINHTVEVTLI